MHNLRLGEILVHDGLLRPDGLRLALQQQQRHGGLLGTNLLELGLLPEEGLLKALGRQCSTPVVGKNELRNIPESLLDRLPRQLVERYRLLPFRLDGNTLLIASMRPGDLAIEDYIANRTALMTRTHVGLEVRIWEALTRFYAVQAPDRLLEVAKKLDRPSSSATRIDELLGGSDADSDSAAAAAESPSTVLWTGLGEGAGSTSATASVELPRVDARPRLPTSLEEAVASLEGAERRDRIAELTLAGTAPFLERRLLLARRGNRLIGWRGDGPGLVSLRVHGLNFQLTDSPVFLALESGSRFWLGPLVASPVHERITQIFGGGLPRDCLVMPIRARDRTVAFLYGDNRGRSVAGVPLTELQRLLDRTALALLRFLRRRKRELEAAAAATAE